MFTEPPSHFSVQELLAARQHGVPDYVIMPMLQKTMALQQAAQTQAQMQPQQKPPIAQQVMGQAKAQEQAQPQLHRPAGIEALHSGLPPQYAKGGILAFNGEEPEGSVVPDGDQPIGDTIYTKKEGTPEYQIAQYDKYAGTSKVPEVGAKSVSDRQASIAEDKARAPWMALMRAGTAMMASKSPNALQGIGEGLSEGLSDYTGRQKEIGTDEKALDELKIQLAQSERNEQMARANHGITSAQAVKAAAETAKDKQKYYAAIAENKAGMLAVAQQNAETNQSRGNAYIEGQQNKGSTSDYQVDKMRQTYEDQRRKALAAIDTARAANPMMADSEVAAKMAEVNQRYDALIQSIGGGKAAITQQAPQNTAPPPAQDKGAEWFNSFTGGK